MLIFKKLAVISVTASYLRGGGFSGGIGFVGAAASAVEEAGGDFKVSLFDFD